MVVGLGREPLTLSPRYMIGSHSLVIAILPKAEYVTGHTAIEVNLEP